MEEKLNLRDVFGIFKKYAGWILLLTVLMALIAGIITYSFLVPMYEGTAQILVNEEAGGEPGLESRNIEADLQLVNTYSGIIESPVILEKVIDELGLAISTDELNNKITVVANPDSQLINITATDASQSKAAEIANTTAGVFEEEVKQIMNLNNVQILSSAAVKENPETVSTNPLFNIAVGAAIGLFLGMGLAFLLAYLDTSIKNEEDIEKVLGLPVLAVIPPVKEVSGDSNADGVILKEKEA